VCSAILCASPAVVFVCGRRLSSSEKLQKCDGIQADIISPLYNATEGSHCLTLREPAVSAELRKAGMMPVFCGIKFTEHDS
jgi:hypothetical protein